MLFHVASHLEYAVTSPSTLILNIHGQRTPTQKILQESLVVEPGLAAEELAMAGTDNRYIRIETGAHRSLAISYRASVDCDFGTYRADAADQTLVADLSGSAVPFLFPSRYCQSDQLGKLAWDLVGAIEKPHAKVVAITDWIHDHVEYSSGSTHTGTSACDTLIHRTGVCRDFAHLGIALCRASNIPARYLSGYAYELQPPDFHACFECLIGGRWVVFDATRMAHLNGLVRIGTGRDAADAAVATIFGAAVCISMTVSCTLGPGQAFAGVGRTQLDRRGVTLAPTA